MNKILVAIDGSKNSNKALLEAKKIAKALNSRVDIMNVIKDVVVNPYVVEQYYTVEDLKPLSEKLLEDALEYFGDCKGEIKTMIRTGNAADAIIKEVEKEGYDLVVMGSRGLGTFSRAMLGSVSSKVLNHVKTNVLIIKE